MHPTLFMDPSTRSLSSKSISTISPIPLNQGGGKGFEEYQVPINGGMPSLSDPNIALPTTRTRSGGATKSKPQKEKKENGRRKKPRRIIDEGHVIEPTDDDVFFGKGGKINIHPGNIKFRNKALELRPWYEASTKEEKFNISQLLIESVKSEGHRFLEKGKDGLWHEVIGNGARKKASQALRERIRTCCCNSKLCEEIGYSHQEKVCPRRFFHPDLLMHLPTKEDECKEALRVMGIEACDRQGIWDNRSDHRVAYWHYNQRHLMREI